MKITSLIPLFLALFLASCAPSIGVKGDPGPEGERGPKGDPGAPGGVGPEGPPGASLVKGGSRLSALCIAGDDGSEECLRLFDSERGEECAFRRIEGEYYCTPEWASTPLDHYSSWASPDCTGPMARGPLWDGRSCVHFTGSGARYCVSEESVVGALYVQDSVTKQCALWTSTTEPWRLWPEVTLENFVHGTEK